MLIQIDIPDRILNFMNRCFGDSRECAISRRTMADDVFVLHCIEYMKRNLFATAVLEGSSDEFRLRLTDFGVAALGEYRGQTQPPLRSAVEAMNAMANAYVMMNDSRPIQVRNPSFMQVRAE